MSLLPFLALIPPAPMVMTVPPIVTVDSEITTTVLSFRAGRARCGSGEETLAISEPPLPQIGGGLSSMPAPAPVTLSFRIDAAGRPLSIVEAPRSRSDGPYYDRGDIAAALAASRFRAGRERTG